MDKIVTEVFYTIANKVGNAVENLIGRNEIVGDINDARSCAAYFHNLATRIKTEGENFKPTRSDATFLKLGTSLYLAQVEDDMKELQKTYASFYYLNDVLGSLEKSELTDAEFEKIIAEKFTFDNNE